MKTLVWLPTKTFEGVSFVRVGAREAWLNQAMGGRVDCPECVTAIDRAKDVVVQEWRAARSRANGKAGVGGEAGDGGLAATLGQEAGVVVAHGRSALGLEDDSDPGEPEGQELMVRQPAANVRSSATSNTVV